MLLSYLLAISLKRNENKLRNVRRFHLMLLKTENTFDGLVVTAAGAAAVAGWGGV